MLIVHAAPPNNEGVRPGSLDQISEGSLERQDPVVVPR
jgi:hypothetical protein